MVYCGRPSKGCSNCRERKIRCDLRGPGCGQCERRLQRCPGYRNLVDLMFRDESSHVIQKANSKSTRHPQSSDGSTPSSSKLFPRTLTWSPTESKLDSNPTESEREPSSSTELSTELSTVVLPQGSGSPPGCLTLDFEWTPKSKPKPKPKPKPKSRSKSKSKEKTEKALKQEPGICNSTELPVPIPYTIPTNLEDWGLNLFIARYVTVSQNSCHHKYDFAFDLWKPPTSSLERARDPVLASITAVGLQSIAQMTQARQPLEAARKSYGQALRLINSALRNPIEAAKDTTMLSVLVLGLYENVAEPSIQTMRAWQQHIKGAATLARIRGANQFQNKAAIRMFMVLCENMMINCMQNEMAMPQDLIDLCKQILAIFGNKEPGFEIFIPIYKTLQLRYDIKERNVTDLDEMLKKLNEAEDDFESVISVFPTIWQYRRCRLTQKTRPGFFNNVFHVYPNIGVATIWNGLRASRMLILGTILEELRKRFLGVPVRLVPARYQLECRKMKFKMERIALAILASVPQYFGLVNPSDDSLEISAPGHSTEDLWTEEPEGDCQAVLGKTEGSASDFSNNEDYYNCSPLQVSNPVLPSDADARAERFMLLASATNGLVWPLYLIGMSTESSPLMKGFIAERLHAVYAETGLAQARTLAEVVASNKRLTELFGQQPQSCG